MKNNLIGIVAIIFIIGMIIYSNYYNISFEGWVVLGIYLFMFWDWN